MTRVLRITGKELVMALGRTGFKVIRIRGSHYFLQHDDGRCTVVPVHSGEIIGPGLLSRILRDCEIKKDELISLLE